MNQKKPILFIDYNGVISYLNFWFSIQSADHQLHKYSGLISDFLFKNNSDIVSDWMLGKYTSEVVNKILSDQFDISFEQLYKVFVEDCMRMDFDKGIYDSLCLLKDKFTIILRTDNMDSFTRFTVPANEQFGIFDEIHNSYELREFKVYRQGSYFLEICDRYGVDIKNCILIDDARKNCDVFDLIGGKSLCVSGVKNVTYTLRSLLFQV